MPKKRPRDDWQLSLQPDFDGDRRGMALFVFSPSLELAKRVTLWGDEMGHHVGLRRVFAEHCAIKLDRKLQEAGVTIPDARTRITDLVMSRWLGG